MKHLIATAFAAVVAFAPQAGVSQTLADNNARMFEQLRAVHNLSAGELAEIRQIFARSGFVGQGNPRISQHPMTEAQCKARAPGGGTGYRNSRFERICGDRYMAPLYDPKTERPEDAKACIDQFEFPNIPCTYPVVWVKASEAAAICEAQGKRLCDAHEWEGACQGAVEEADYRFDLGSVSSMRAAHNSKYESTKRWSYGPAYKAGICGADSSKSASCGGGGFNSCGSNTYPTGAFRNCVSPLGVYDINGNAAEHMNLPLSPDQMASRGSRKLGVTEMKGSWFIFDKYRAHPDWCRWRAPFWHGSKVKSSGSHANYHLGFRCCKSR